MDSQSWLGEPWPRLGCLRNKPGTFRTTERNALFRVANQLDAFGVRMTLRAFIEPLLAPGRIFATLDPLSFDTMERSR